MRLSAANESLSLASDESKADCFVDSSGNMVQEENQSKAETEERSHEDKSDKNTSDNIDFEQEHPQTSNDVLDDSKVICGL